MGARGCCCCCCGGGGSCRKWGRSLCTGAAREPRRSSTPAPTPVPVTVPVQARALAPTPPDAAASASASLLWRRARAAATRSASPVPVAVWVASSLDKCLDDDDAADCFERSSRTPAFSLKLFLAFSTSASPAAGRGGSWASFPVARSSHSSASSWSSFAAPIVRARFSALSQFAAVWRPTKQSGDSAARLLRRRSAPDFVVWARVLAGRCGGGGWLSLRVGSMQTWNVLMSARSHLARASI